MINLGFFNIWFPNVDQFLSRRLPIVLYLRASSTAPLNTMLTFHILPLGGFRLLMVVCYPMKPFSKGILPEIPGIVNHQLVIDRLGFGTFFNTRQHGFLLSQL